MSDWTDELLAISDFCDPERPLRSYEPNEYIRQARSRPSLYEETSDDEGRQEYKGRGYLMKRRMEKPGSASEFLEHQERTTRSIREVNSSGYSNDEIERFIRGRNKSSNESTSQDNGAAVATTPSLSEILQTCQRRRPVRPPTRPRDVADCNPNTIVNQSMPSPRNEVESINHGLNVDCFKDFPELK